MYRGMINRIFYHKCIRHGVKIIKTSIGVQTNTIPTMKYLETKLIPMKLT